MKSNICFCPECTGCDCGYCSLNKCIRAVAQRLERDPYKVDVEGSTPSSTKEEL